MHLDAGLKINHTRPAADPLFASAAEAYSTRVLGIVLSGGDGDGAEGLKLIKDNGGTALVQHPYEARYLSMPHTALKVAYPDAALPIKQMALLVRSFCSDNTNRLRF